MKVINKVYRSFFVFLDRARSFVRLLHLQAKYPSLHIDWSSYIGRHVEIICCDSGRGEIIQTYIAKGTYIKIDEGATFAVRQSYIGADSMIVANLGIDIGPHCSIGEMVVIRDQNHRYGDDRLVKDSGYDTAKIELQENVWLGAKSTVLKGVVLGKNTVVGAHSLVNKSFPDNSVIGGTPAVLLRK